MALILNRYLVKYSSSRIFKLYNSLFKPLKIHLENFFPQGINAEPYRF